jgi:phosphate uptake regulator
MNRAEPMFPSGEVEGFRTRWTEVQTGFVDEPRSAVEQADGLVAEMMKRLAQVFADERGKLEEQWSRGDDISTEDLRQALRRYRSFMDRLLSV